MLTNSRVSAILPAVDIARARKFYEEKLGLKVKKEISDVWGGGVQYDCGSGTTLYVYPRHEATKAEHTAAGFKVDDLDAEVAELKSKGVVFEEYDMPGLKTVNGIAEIGGEKAAWFKDPEGNILVISTSGY